MKTPARSSSLLALLALLPLAALPLAAELRFPMPDVDVVQKAAWIVVGRLKPGSLTLETPPPPPSSHNCWYRGTLVVSEVLAGPGAPRELPIFLGPGVIEGCFWAVEGGPLAAPLRLNDPGWATAMILVENYGFFPWGIDHGNTYEEDALWFLHPWNLSPSPPDGWPAVGLHTAEQVHALGHEDYLFAYLADDPATAVAAAITKDPEMAARAESSLGQLAFVQARSEPDAARRIELFAAALERGAGSLERELRQELLAAGGAALPALWRVLQGSASGALHWRVLQLIREIGDPSVAPGLIELLDGHVRFFARQDLRAPGWYESGTVVEQHERSLRLIDLHDGVWVLGELGDLQAIPVLEAILEQWQGHPQGTDITTSTRRALDKLQATAPPGRGEPGG